MNSVKWIIVAIIITVLGLFAVLISREISSREETRLIIKTQPEQAEMYIAGQRFIAPIDVPFEPGSYTIQISAAGYEQLTKTIRIRPNRRNEFNFPLHREETFLPPEGAP